MKRKWAPLLEESETRTGDGKNPDSGSARAAKNPRIAPPSPKKKPPLHGSASCTPHSRCSRDIRHHPATATASSPTKPTVASLARQVTLTRVPSTSTFKPAIPPKTPAYPPPPRWPRKDENMLSINGSPLANPYELGLEWLAEAGDDPGEREGDRGAGGKGGKEDVVHGQMMLRRTASNIVIRRDLSLVTATGSNTSNSSHHRAKPSHSQSQTQLHSRSDMAATSNSGHLAARVAVPTRDGHLLEFDPLLTSPGALDKLEGITDSAKKQAKEDMSKLVQAAVAKWNVK
ncbi:hypothetical protein F5148DRAFT_1151379 [Russula earlei]|uniref:Uncharacterized protein n=1 Tax=Russula earlei TaxID=71964 RepID=A0ACC0U1C0_9AGAM|nr:hypothetical protein F5148DRAFT_1151379 [Russula earlei]